MKYDWKKIIDDQLNSGLTISKYCDEHHLAVSSFYKNKRKLQEVSASADIFLPVEVIDDISALVSMNIDGHTVEFDSSLLSKVIGALK